MLHTVNKFVETYAQRSMDECLACFKQSDEIVVFGSLVDEKRIGINALRAQLERDWAQSLATSLEMTWHKAVSHGGFGWVAAELTFRFKTSSEEGVVRVRASFVLEQDASGGWLIEHMHFSVPDSGTEVGRSFN